MLVIGCLLLLCVCTDNCAVFAYSSVGFPFQIYINSLRPNNIPMDHRVRKILFAFVSILLNTKTQILLLLLLLCLCVLFNYCFLSDFLLLFSMIIIFSNNIITHERKLRSTAWVEWIHKVHAAHNEPNIHSLLSRTTSNNPPHPAQLVSMPHYVGKPTQPLGPYGSGGRNPFGPMSGNHRSASSMPVT